MAKYVSFESGGIVRYGELNGAQIQPLEGEFPTFRLTGETPVPLDSVKLLAPVTPTKVICVGANYRIYYGHAPLPDRPIFWVRPLTSLNGPEGEIPLPRGYEAMIHESEIAIVIGKRAHRVSVEDAAEHIFGYTCVNDGTVADFSDFAASPYFVYGKSFDGSGSIGPCIATDIDPNNLHLECRVNGEVRQSHNTSDLVFNPVQLVSMISDVMTLLPGDVIATGSPPGQKPMRDGDVVEVEVENIGVLRNYPRDRA